MTRPYIFPSSATPLACGIWWTPPSAANMKPLKRAWCVMWRLSMIAGFFEISWTHTWTSMYFPISPAKMSFSSFSVSVPSRCFLMNLQHSFLAAFTNRNAAFFSHALSSMYTSYFSLNSELSLYIPPHPSLNSAQSAQSLAEQRPDWSSSSLNIMGCLALPSMFFFVNMIAEVIFL